MESATRTVYSSYIQTCLLLGLPPTYPANTTLNQKFGILQDVLPAQTDRPRLGYYGIGNRGHQMVVGGNDSGATGIYKPEPVQHRATDAALYGHLPFVLRPLTNDLTSIERARYAMRREEIHNGSTYAAYYLRRLDTTNVTPMMETKVITDGQANTVPFIPNSSCLNPTPPNIASTGVNVTGGEYVSASAKLSLSLTPDDAAELLNVARILYNDEGYAIISEIGLCTGVDKVIQVTGSQGGTFNFNEVIGAQIATHIPAMVSVGYNNQGTEITLAVGATEPLFALSAP